MTPLEAVIANSRRLACTTKRQYRMVVRDFVAFTGSDAHNWTPATCDAWMQQLSVKPISANAYIAAIRWASSRWAALTEGARDFAVAVETVLVSADKHVTSPAPLSELTLNDLLASCGRDDNPADLRDRAIIAIAINTGFRRAEIAGIEFDDLDRADRSIVVIAKRNRRHRVRVAAACWDRIDAWLAWLRRRHVFDGRVFRALRRCLDAELGWCVEGTMSAEAIYRVVRRRARRAGIVGRVCSHTLRHSLVALLRDRGVPDSEIQRRLGHASIETTMRYGGELVCDASEGLPT